MLRASLILWAAAVCGSLLATPNLPVSLPLAAAALAGATLVFAATFWPPAKPVRPQLVVWILLGCGVLTLAITLLTARWPTDKLSFMQGLYGCLPSIRSNSLAWLADGLQPNQLGGILATFVGFALVIALTPRPAAVARGQQIAALILAVTGAFTVFLTGSRAALAGVAVALLFALVIRNRRWLLLPPALVAALVIGELIHPGIWSNVADLLLHDQSAGTKLVGRLDIWVSTLHGIQDHAFTGMGLGVFNEVIPVRYPYETVGIAHSVSQAHNLILDTTISLGVCGAFALLGILTSLGLMVWGTPRNKTMEHILMVALTASFLVYLVFGVTDSLSASSPAGFIVWLWALPLVMCYRTISLSTKCIACVII